MTIEAQLKRIADTFEKLAGLPIPSAGKAEKEPAKKKEKDKAGEGASMEDLRAVLRDVIKTHGKSKAQDLLADHNASKLSELDDEDRAAFLKEARELAEG